MGLTTRRSTFIAAVAAMLGMKVWGQESRPATGGDVTRAVEKAFGKSNAPKPHERINGECPVCRTMAAPFHRLVAPCREGNTCAAVVDGLFVVGDSIGTHLVRCQMCNAAFFQDAV